MDLLDESLEGMASCASARASGPLLAKLSEVGYCRDGVPTTIVSMKDERDNTRCYNPLSSSLYFTFHPFSLSTYLER